MVVFVLDASAMLRFVDDEAGAERVSEAFQIHAAGRAQIVMSAIQWGEVAGVFYKRYGLPGVDRIVRRLRALHVEVIPVSADRAERSAVIKATRRIPYADSFAVELASETPQHVLITAHFDYKPAEQDIAIEFLPPKSKPSSPLAP